MGIPEFQKLDKWENTPKGRQENFRAPGQKPEKETCSPPPPILQIMILNASPPVCHKQEISKTKIN